MKPNLGAIAEFKKKVRPYCSYKGCIKHFKITLYYSLQKNGKCLRKDEMKSSESLKQLYLKSCPGTNCGPCSNYHRPTELSIISFIFQLTNSLANATN